MTKKEKRKYEVKPCPQCEKDIELKKHINRCTCGAVIKVLQY
jgi:ribosomal protein S27AE